MLNLTMNDDCEQKSEYYILLKKHFKNVEDILQKDELSELDISICCLQLRFCFEDIFYDQLLFYKNYLSDDEFKNYSVGKIIKYILPLNMQFIKNNNKIKCRKLTIKFSTSKTENKFEYEYISTNDIEHYYNKLGKYLHEQHPNENLEKLNKNELIEIRDYLEKIVENLSSIKFGYMYKCLCCERIFPYQIVSDECRCPNCLATYKIRENELVPYSDLECKSEDGENVLTIFTNSEKILNDIKSKIQKSNSSILNKGIVLDCPAYDNKNFKKYNMQFKFKLCIDFVKDVEEIEEKDNNSQIM